MLKDLYDRAKRALTKSTTAAKYAVDSLTDATHTDPPPNVRRISNGPFKGRVYELRPDGRLGRRLA